MLVRVVNQVVNPVLPGMHPDPSILRVGDDYFLATSTFQWAPGIALHHSRDLQSWRALGHALTRFDQLDLRGVPDSGGVWAPSLSHDGRRFYLTYPVIESWRWPKVSCSCFYVTADQGLGPWSTPVYLHSRGWDPSMFHDRDGRTWLVSMVLDDRLASDRPMAGIQLQQLDVRTGRLRGEPQLVFRGTGRGYTEGPHLYRRGDWVYLVTAEGGTAGHHAAVVARARSVEGPYEVAPGPPLMTTADDPSSPLQRVGHACLVDAADGNWYAAYLCGRPRDGASGCFLGREAALAPLQWSDDGWPRLAGGGHHPPVRFEAPSPALVDEQVPAAGSGSTPGLVGPPGERVTRDDFVEPALRAEWQTARLLPSEDWLSLGRRADHLSIRGGAPLDANLGCHLVARRIQSFHVAFQTRIDFTPTSPRQAAGLTCYTDGLDHVLLAVTGDDRGGRVLRLTLREAGQFRDVLTTAGLPAGPCRLRVTIEHPQMRFWWSGDDDASPWQAAGPAFPTAMLCDAHAGKECFTGAFVGLHVEDGDQRSVWAAFDWFEEADSTFPG